MYWMWKLQGLDVYNDILVGICYIIQISLVSMYRLIIRISRIKELRGK